MQYISEYESPLGAVTLAADSEGIIGLWFNGQKHFGTTLDGAALREGLPVLDEARRWLDMYFSGAEPDFELPLHFIGSDFQKATWQILAEIPYGKTITYGEIAKRLGGSGMSARAVGNAVGKNPISIIVPCHRVVGSNDKLTGYAGGLDRKTALLKLEGLNLF